MKFVLKDIICGKNKEYVAIETALEITVCQRSVIFMTLGSRSLISHHGWTLSQITYIGPTAELARKRLM